MDRRLNYIYSFFLIVLFTLATGADQHWQIITGIILALLCSSVAFFSQSLTLDGMIASTIIGTYIFGLGGMEAALIVLLFFVSSILISKSEDRNDSKPVINTRRDGLQVWANGFWPVFFLILFTIYHRNIFLIAAMTAVATATADTWATELKSRKEGNTYLITDFKKVSYGTNGGVSLKGTIAGLVGSLLIGALTALLFSFPFYEFIFISIAGFLGCTIDSIMGAVFQKQHKIVLFPIKQFSFCIDNNIVNLVSTGAGAALAVIFEVLFI